jgi:hypothetical protein
MSKRRLIFDSLRKIIGRNFRALPAARPVLGSSEPGSSSSSSSSSAPTKSSGKSTPSNRAAMAAAAAGGAAAAGATNSPAKEADVGEGGKKTGLGLPADSVAYKW